MPDQPLLVTKRGKKYQPCWLLCESEATTTLLGHPVCQKCRTTVETIQREARWHRPTFAPRIVASRTTVRLLTRVCGCGVAFSYKARAGNHPKWCHQCRKRHMAYKRKRAERKAQLPIGG